MAKNLVKNNAQPMAMEMGVENMESKAASGNYKKDAAYEAPMKVNEKRNMPHLGAMPRKGSGQF